jgi:hypothetical protein
LLMPTSNNEYSSKLKPIDVQLIKLTLSKAPQ